MNLAGSETFFRSLSWRSRPVGNYIFDKVKPQRLKLPSAATLLPLQPAPAKRALNLQIGTCHLSIGCCEEMTSCASPSTRKGTSQAASFLRLSGHSGHGWNCCSPDPVANDHRETWAASPARPCKLRVKSRLLQGDGCTSALPSNSGHSSGTMITSASGRLQTIACRKKPPLTRAATIRRSAS